MKFKSLALGGALMAMFALAAVGCNENPTTPDGSAPGAPSNAKAVSISATSVGLMWDASADAGVTYNVYVMQGSTNIDTLAVASGTSMQITGLSAGAYTFTIKAAKDGLESAGASVTWAPAERYNQDGATTIRIYEKLSSKGSGLILDPDKGGPTNVSVATGTPGLVQLAIVATADKFTIGPAFAFPDYKNVDKFDNQVFISDSTYLSSTMSDLYLSKSLDQYFTKADANLRAFDLPISVTGANASMGHNFFVRLQGTGGTHYARIFVKNIGGKLLQGSGNERYVELEVSYQNSVNVPYAKTAPRAQSPAGVGSRQISQ